MARVSEAGGGRSAPSPLAREGAGGGLSKLIRSSGMAEGVSVPLVSSSSKSPPLSPASRASMSYAPASDISRWFEASGKGRGAAAGAGMEVMGRGEGTSVSRGEGPTASGTLGAAWWREEED